MSPFKGPSWNEAVKQTLEKKKFEEELAAKMKEHDYSECYCHALKNPPWGGYSSEEQILHETKQRKKTSGQENRQTTGTSSCTYLKKDQEAILGEAAVLQTTNVQPDLLDKLITTQLEHLSISKAAKAHTPSTHLEDLPNEVLCKIINNLEAPELGTLSEASRRFTIFIGPVPCGDAFAWARHRCLIHKHTRHASLCGDCIAALIARNKYDVSFVVCRGKSLLPTVAAFASRIMHLGSVLGTFCERVGHRLLRFDQGNARQVRVSVDVRPRYGEIMVPY